MRNTTRLFLRVLAGAVLFAFVSGEVPAAEQRFGPFAVDDAKPEVIALNGAIDNGAALNFRRALQAAPNARLVTLNSAGGDVQMGLLIADDIHQRKLSTYIPENSRCYSACSYIFLAGNKRRVDGELGVHQISSDSPDLVGAQLAISDIIEVLNRFDTPMEVMHVMFKTPPDQMHVFTVDEIERFRLNRASAERPETVPNAERQGPPAPVALNNAPSSAGRPGAASAAPGTDASPETIAEKAQGALSPLEEFTKRPNRIAIYTGLDLFGDDISSLRVAGAGDCAESCLRMNGQCKAFTFNLNPKIKRGPNCFLKASAGRADANSVAFSGQFLSASDSDPRPMTLAAIDPQTALYEDIDLPGGDLFRRPDPSARTPLACRLACIDEARCVAFTYLKSRKECWLKGNIGDPRVGKGMVSGLKTYKSFTPADIMSLD